MPAYKYFISGAAERDLNKVGGIEQQRIGRKPQYFISVDDPSVFAIQLTDIKPPIYRFRVGKYLVFFDVKGVTLRILSISLRDKAYR